MDLELVEGQDPSSFCSIADHCFISSEMRGNLLGVRLEVRLIALDRGSFRIFSWV